MYLTEVTSLKNYEILEEQVDNGMKSLTVKGIFQTANEINQNNRKYPKDLLKEGVDSVQEYIKSSQLLGELSHPISSELQRILTVDLKEVSHEITSLKLEDNDVVGQFRTLSTPNGTILYNLLKSGLTIGISLRAGGKTEQKDEYLEIVRPFKLITYDAVNRQSHSKAQVQLEGINEAMDTFLGLSENKMSRNKIDRYISDFINDIWKDIK